MKTCPAIRVCMLLMLVVFSQASPAQGVGGWLDLGGRSGSHTPQQQINSCSAELKTHPDDATAFYNRGLAYASTGKYDKAIPDYGNAIRLKPNFPEAYAERGDVYSFLGDDEKALADYKAAVSLGGGDRLQKAYLGLAEIYGDQGDLGKDLEYHNRIVQTWPGDATNYENRAHVYMARKEYDKAIADYSKAIELYAGYDFPELATDPAYLGLFVERGEAWFRNGVFDKAISDFKRAAYGGINAAAWFYATCPDAKFRDGSKAVGLAKKGGDHDALAAAYAELGHWAEAIKAEKQMIAKEKSEKEFMVRVYKAQGLETRSGLLEKGYEESIKEYASRLALYEQKKPCREVKYLQMNYQ